MAGTQMAGRTVVVTGANSGIGKATAQALAAQGATVVFACRDVGKAQTAIEEIRSATGNNNLEAVKLDLASDASIETAAKEISAKHPKLDVLVNNAGGWTTDRQQSQDGVELQWASNVKGPLRFTEKLLPVLEASGAGRIVNVASTSAGNLDLEDVEWKNKAYDGVKQYMATKQANRMLTWALARKLAGKPVVANAMSPGLVATQLNRDARGFFKFLFGTLRIFARTPEKGADTSVWLASSPDAARVSGKFFVDRKETACKFRNESAEDKLWSLVA